MTLLNQHNQEIGPFCPDRAGAHDSLGTRLIYSRLSFWVPMCYIYSWLGLSITSFRPSSLWSSLANIILITMMQVIIQKMTPCTCKQLMYFLSLPYCPDHLSAKAYYPTEFADNAERSDTRPQQDRCDVLHVMHVPHARVTPL